MLLEDTDGESDRVSGQDLGTLLHDHRSLRLAVLNACEGARGSRTDPFAGTAQSLVQQGLPAVIAMQFEVSDEAAIMLAHEFYGAIADSYPVDAALAEARKALFAAGNRVEWGTPVLYLRAPDGKIFDVAPAAQIAPALSVPVAPPPPKGQGTAEPATLQRVEARSEQSPPSASALPTLPLEDPRLLRARAAGLTERWREALALYEELATAFILPEHVRADLEQARRETGLLQQNLAAEEATTRQDWSTAVTLLEQLAQQLPDDGEIARRLADAREEQKLAAWAKEADDLAKLAEWGATNVLLAKITQVRPDYTHATIDIPLLRRKAPAMLAFRRAVDQGRQKDWAGVVATLSVVPEAVATEEMQALLARALAELENAAEVAERERQAELAALSRKNDTIQQNTSSSVTTSTMLSSSESQSIPSAAAPLSQPPIPSLPSPTVDTSVGQAVDEQTKPLAKTRAKRPRYTIVIPIVLVIVVAWLGISFYRYQAQIKWINTGDKAVINGSVYVSDYNQYIYAVDGSTGVVKWKAQTDSNNHDSAIRGPYADNEALYYHGRTALYAIDTTTGLQKWSFPLDLIWEDITVGDNTIYARGKNFEGSNEDTFYAIDKRDGKEKWKHAPVYKSAITKDSIYILSDKIYSFDNNGKVQWEFPINVGSSHSDMNISVEGSDALQIQDSAQHFYIVDSTNGRTRWDYRTTDATKKVEYYTGAHGIGYITTCDNNSGTPCDLMAVDSMTGAQKWKVESIEGSSQFPDIMFVGNVIIYRMESSIVARDIAGNVKWEVQVGEIYDNSDIIEFEGTIYFATDHLYAIDVESGEVKWKSDEDFAWYKLILTTDTIYTRLRTADGGEYIYALDSRSGNVKWKFDINNKKGGDDKFGHLELYNDTVYVFLRSMSCSLPFACEPPVIALDKTTGGMKWGFKP